MTISSSNGTNPATTENKAATGVVSTPQSKSRERVELGPFAVKDLLERDHTGHVYRAHHSQSNHPVAIKVLPPLQEGKGQLPAWPRDCLDELSQEVATASGVVHDNVARPKYLGKQNDVQYIAMEYVDGVSLQKIVERDGQVDPATACEIILQVASGLRHIHENGLVHRDLRPANIVLTREGVIKIMDLGTGQLKRTELREHLGDVAYLAPEYLRSGEYDIRSDIYSLGCTAYRLLCGATPEPIGELPAGTRPLLEVNPAVPERLAAVVHRMMAPDPEARFATPHDVIVELNGWADGEKLPDLVAWHMNTKNAGLAPVVTFQRLERRRRLEADLHRVAKLRRRKRALFGSRMQDPRPDLGVHGNRPLSRFLGRWFVVLLAVPLLSALAVVSFPQVVGIRHVGSSVESSIAAPLVAPTPNAETSSYHASLLRELEHDYGLPTGDWVLPPNGKELPLPAIRYGMEMERVVVEDQGFTKAVRLRVAERGAATWDAGYFFPDVAGIRQGDHLLLVVWLRVGRTDSHTDTRTDTRTDSHAQLGQQPGNVTVFVEDATTGQKDTYQAIQPTLPWRRYVIPFEAKSNALRRVGFHLASPAQTVEYGGMALINYHRMVALPDLPIHLGD